MIGESSQYFFLSTLDAVFLVLCFKFCVLCSCFYFICSLFVCSLLILPLYTAAAVYVDIADQSFAFETDKTAAIGFG